MSDGIVFFPFYWYLIIYHIHKQYKKKVYIVIQSHTVPHNLWIYLLLRSAYREIMFYCTFRYLYYRYDYFIALYASSLNVWSLCGAMVSGRTHTDFTIDLYCALSWISNSTCPFGHGNGNSKIIMWACAPCSSHFCTGKCSCPFSQVKKLNWVERQI